MDIMKMRYRLPTNYSDLDPFERKEVREQYIAEQGGKCLYCGESLSTRPPKRVTDRKINWKLFPPQFLKHPIHLHHCHKTNLTQGAVHAYCNAVLWQHERQ